MELLILMTHNVEIAQAFQVRIFFQWSRKIAVNFLFAQISHILDVPRTCSVIVITLGLSPSTLSLCRIPWSVVIQSQVSSWQTLGLLETWLFLSVQCWAFVFVGLLLFGGFCCSWGFCCLFVFTLGVWIFFLFHITLSLLMQALSKGCCCVCLLVLSFCYAVLLNNHQERLRHRMGTFPIWFYEYK